MLERLWAACVLFLGACASGPQPSGAPAPAISLSPPPPVTAAPANAAPGAPLSGPPRLVIENHSNADIRLYSGSIVDEAGKLGTMKLWPHPHDCPAYEPKERLLRLGGVYDLPAPIHGYDDKRCAPGRELPPGRYVVHIASGYADALHASAELTLPLAAPVRLEMRQHDKPPSCTPARAARAARLTIAAAEAAGVPPATLRGCDPANAACGSLPLPEGPPPAVCTLTLHETTMRIRRPPEGNPPSQITSWLDHDLVLARRPDVSRSSAATVTLGADRIVVEGVTEHHIHVHGGDAARIRGMVVRVFNPSQRTLKVRVVGVDWLTDHSCGVPKEAPPAPAVTGFHPKVLAPGATTLALAFTPRDAYQAHCDIFASRARLEIEGVPVSVIGEHAVTREEPFPD